MWLNTLRRKLTGSDLSLKEREVLALEEHNALLRAQLELQGAKNLPRRVLSPIGRRRTERDIVHVTRESLWEQQQIAKGEASRPWNKPDPQPVEAAPRATTSSTPDPTSKNAPSETF